MFRIRVRNISLVDLWSLRDKEMYLCVRELHSPIHPHNLMRVYMGMAVECSGDCRFFVFCFFFFLLRTAVEGEGEHHVLSGHIDLTKAAVPEIAQKHTHC